MPDSRAGRYCTAAPSNIDFNSPVASNSNLRPSLNLLKASITVILSVTGISDCDFSYSLSDSLDRYDKSLGGALDINSSSLLYLDSLWLVVVLGGWAVSTSRGIKLCKEQNVRVTYQYLIL